MCFLCLGCGCYLAAVPLITKGQKCFSSGICWGLWRYFLIVPFFFSKWRCRLMESFVLQECVFRQCCFTFLSRCVQTFRPLCLVLNLSSLSCSALGNANRVSRDYIIVDKKAMKSNMRVFSTVMNSSKLTSYSAHHTVKHFAVAPQQTSGTMLLRGIFLMVIDF